MSFLQDIRKAKADGGKPATQQLVEALQLRLGHRRIGLSEYFEYGLYKRDVSPECLTQFIGWRESGELDRRLNDDYSRVLANDKLLNYLLLQHAGFPIPEPIASFTPTRRSIGGEIRLGSIDEVRAFLDSDIYPFYSKPIAAGYGRSVFGVVGKEGDQLRLMSGQSLEMSEFLKPFSFAPYRGMLFQKPLAAHPEIEALTGTSAVCCVRMICFVTSKGPMVHTAFWKIATGRNMLDNFSHGHFGNCLAAVDIERGRIMRVIEKLGPGGEVVQLPGTGKAVRGFELPDWDKAVRLVCDATTQFPGLRLQNWDVALCPGGPVLLELNTESELAVPQAISGRGILDDRLKDILKSIDADRQTYANAIAAGHPKEVVVT